MADVITGWNEVDEDDEIDFAGGHMAILGEGIAANTTFDLQITINGNDWFNVTRGADPDDLSNTNRFRTFNHLPAGTYRLHKSGTDTSFNLHWAYCPASMQDAARY